MRLSIEKLSGARLDANSREFGGGAAGGTRAGGGDGVTGN